MNKGNNHGFSLIELIVVMTIVGIMLLTASSGLEYLNSGNVNRFVKELDNNMKKTRYESMSMVDKSYALVLEHKEDGYYLYNVQSNDVRVINSLLDASFVGTSKKIGDKQFSVEYEVTQENVKTLEENQYIILQYYSHNGAFASNYKNITLSLKKHTQTIMMVKKTGKHSVL